MRIRITLLGLLLVAVVTACTSTPTAPDAPKQASYNGSGFMGGN